MEPEESWQAARGQAQALVADGVRVLEIPVRMECADFLADLPEPPRTHRAAELHAGAASGRLQRGRPLLARLWALKEQGTSGLEVLERAICAAIRLHAFAAERRLTEAELAWVEARKRAAAALSPFRLWESERPVLATFDRATGLSRYDPHDTPLVELKLECPASGCARLGRHRPERDAQPQALKCPACGTRFFAWFLEALGPATVLPGRQCFRTRTSEGGEVEIIVPDDEEALFAVASGDLLAFLGPAPGRWVAVENLATGGRYRPRGSGPCFIVAELFGARAPELRAFRAFRDEALLPRATGKALVGLYYRTGPWVAWGLRRSQWARRAARAFLTEVHGALRMRGYGGR